MTSKTKRTRMTGMRRLMKTRQWIVLEGTSRRTQSSSKITTKVEWCTRVLDTITRSEATPMGLRTRGGAEETCQHAEIDSAMNSLYAVSSGTFAECPAIPLSPISPTVPKALRTSDTTTIALALTIPDAAYILRPSATPDIATLPKIYLTVIASLALDSQNVVIARGLKM
ncbi:hypothetical protein B9Z19DRAFT_1068070 [Tuber borchii]|uniref:Uncharacterized protein n=1 Tax=Tuber borchii TaxID=42251 RepID=A0A2T6ZGL8_TUBBO|nr:hypothetical protein B9Z19DRAFT_1068070 [Tuber borchii]